MIELISYQSNHLYECQNVDDVTNKVMMQADNQTIQSEVPLPCMAQSCAQAASLDSAPEQEPRSLTFVWNDPPHTCTQCYSHREPVNMF